MKIWKVAGLAALTLFAGCRVQNPCPEVSWKLYNVYDGAAVPDFTTMGEPDAEGVTNDFTLLGIPGAIHDHFAARLEGDVYFEEEGKYQIFFVCDDGGLLFIDDSLAIDHDGKHGISVKTDSIYLSKGVHDFRVDYFNYDKALKLEVLWSKDGGPLCRLFNPGPEIPAFVMEQAQEAYERFAAWKGDDETVVFPILTDVHASGRDVHKHIGYVAQTDALFHFDFMANLGDIGLNDPLTSTMKWYADQVVADTRAEMAKYDGVFLYVAGNHDWDAGEGGHNSSAQLSEWFQQPSLAKAGGNLHLVPGKCYGWYDLPDKDLRVILLNSEGTDAIGTTYIYDDEQLDWLEGVLADTPGDMSVIAFSHLCPHSVGWWIVGSMEYKPGSERLMSIFSQYRNAGGRLLAVICGDSHCNACGVQDGVPYFISQGYGGDMGIEGMQQDKQKRAWFNYTSSLCVDVIGIKPATGEVRSFRMGAGGADMDYIIADNQSL